MVTLAGWKEPPVNQSSNVVRTTSVMEAGSRLHRRRITSLGKECGAGQQKDNRG